MNNSIQKARLSISGKVQGVFYRVSTRERAAMLNLYGWVRNRSDGRVEAYCLGSREQIEELISWCWQGPTGATVDRVEVEWLELSSEDKQILSSGQFEIQRDL